MRGAVLVSLTGLFLFAPGPSQAQAPPKFEFEVASVRPKPLEGTVYHPGISIAGTRVTLSGPVQSLVMTAFGMRQYQIVGAPAWNNLYEITAKAPGESAPSREQARQMVRTLLVDRFQLKFHRQTKELPVYQLTVARGGPKLKESAPDAQFGMNTRGSEVTFSGASMATLVNQFLFYPLSDSVDRPVLDKTGLTGKYDFTLRWAPLETPADATDAPSIFTAMQEQLGLRLESGKGPIEILVIDHVEKPSEN
jgi:uncharacterized protein (TIGR03435 family)